MPVQSRRRFFKYAGAAAILGAVGYLGFEEFLGFTRQGSVASCSPSSSTESYPDTDYSFFIEPYQSEVSRLVGWLTMPWSGGGGYGYDSTYNLIRGGNWPGYVDSGKYDNAGGTAYQSGYHPGMVLIDSNFILGMSLDSFTKSTSAPTNIYNTCRDYLTNNTFINPATGASPSSESYSGNDRREIFLGKFSPYYVQGKGPTDAVYQTASQIWYIPGHTLAVADSIVTALPTNPVPYMPEDMEFYAPWILLQYMKGNVAGAKADFLNVIGSWQGGCPGQIGPPYGGNYTSRTLSFTIAVARCCVDTDGTPFWQLPNVQPVLADMIQSLWAIQGSDGGIPTSYNPSAGETPESTGEALMAFDPNLPERFS